MEQAAPVRAACSFSFHGLTRVLNETPWCPAPNNKTARCASNTRSNKKRGIENKAGAVIPSTKRQNEYQGYRAGTPDRPIIISTMPIFVGAALIAAAILLSTLFNALGTRYLGFEGPTEESAWLVDRMTGHV